MKNFKEFLKSKGISEEDYAKKSVEEMALLQSDYADMRIKEISESLKKAASDEDVQALTKKLNAFVEASKEINDESFKALQKTIKTQGEAITKLKEEGGKGELNEVDSIEKQIKDHFKKNPEEYKTLQTVKGAKMQLTIKAAGTILTSTNLTPAGNRIARTETEAGTVGFVRRNPFILDIVSVRPTKAKVIYWVEMVNADGTVAMTAEGVVKSQIDWDYVEASERVKKITAFTKVSKEMLDDVDEFAADIANELTERIQLFADDAFLKADGAGENITGIETNATAFAAGGLTDMVDNANKLDVLRAAVAQVYRNNFIPTYIVINPDDSALMDLQKGSDGHYLLPPFIAAGGMAVKGIPVIMNNNVTADEFYCGDFKKYRVRIREEIDIQIGYDGNDWTKNLVTPLAEMRAVGFIPANHYGAIVFGTFTAAAADLETP